MQDLYAANKDNKAFLHTRFSLGDDPLETYKAAIIQGINPPNFRHPVSVSKAKKAISDYKKALDQPLGLAELTALYCEQVFKFLTSCGMEDEDYFDALVWMFEQALKYVQDLPAAQQPAFLGLNRVRQLGQNIGWGVGEGLDYFWSNARVTNED